MISYISICFLAVSIYYLDYHDLRILIPSISSLFVHRPPPFFAYMSSVSVSTLGASSRDNITLNESRFVCVSKSPYKPSINRNEIS